VDQGLATLIAASIAAFAALLTLVIQLSSQRYAELRVAHRQSLVPYTAELGEALHSVIATSRVLLKTKSEVAYNKWRAYGRKAQAELKELRPKLRYPLWGADFGIKVLTRLPDWTDHLRGEPGRADRLLERANNLRIWIDRAVRRGYLDGRPPSWLQKRMIAYYARKCQGVFKDRPEVTVIDSLEWLLVDDDDPALKAVSEEMMRLLAQPVERPRKR